MVVTAGRKGIYMNKFVTLFTLLREWRRFFTRICTHFRQPWTASQTNQMRR